MDLLLVVNTLLAVVLLVGMFLLYLELRQLREDLLRRTSVRCGDSVIQKIQCLDARLKDLDKYL